MDLIHLIYLMYLYFLFFSSFLPSLLAFLLTALLSFFLSFLSIYWKLIYLSFLLSICLSACLPACPSIWPPTPSPDLEHNNMEPRFDLGQCTQIYPDRDDLPVYLIPLLIHLHVQLAQQLPEWRYAGFLPVPQSKNAPNISSRMRCFVEFPDASWNQHDLKWPSFNMWPSLIGNGWKNRKSIPKSHGPPVVSIACNLKAICTCKKDQTGKSRQLGLWTGQQLIWEPQSHAMFIVERSQMLHLWSQFSLVMISTKLKQINLTIYHCIIIS